MDRQSTSKHFHNHHHYQNQQQQQLSVQEWESVIEDFNSGSPTRQARWQTVPISDLAISALVRRDLSIPFKVNLLQFLEEFHSLIIPSPSSLLDSLRSILQLPDSIPLKEQSMVCVTSVIISLFDLPLSKEFSIHVAALVEVLLSLTNKPNHSPDRSVRSTACECLRELERAFPGLLSGVAGHLYSLAEQETTHAAASYLLLLATVCRGILSFNLLSSSSPVFSTSTPLVPFNCPQLVLDSSESLEHGRDPTEINLRVFGKVLRFLMERPQMLTPSMTMELVAEVTAIGEELEAMVPAVAALLKVQFSGLLNSYNPMLWHTVLMLYARFADTFAGDGEQAIARRLALVSQETYQPLVFRLLALHWLLGSPRMANWKDSLAQLVNSFYPAVFDPLSLKAKKLDALTFIAACLDREHGVEGTESKLVKVLEDGLVCVSAFKYLPSWSTETRVAFRALHNFLIGVAPHHRDETGEDLHPGAVLESTIYQMLQNMLVTLSLEHRRLVPVIVSFVDRLLKCKAHQQVGENFLQTLDERLLQRLQPGYHMVSYFLIFERIAESDTVPPCNLLGLLTRHIMFLAQKHGADTGLRSWSQGSKVLSICRTMLAHHHSSRVFVAMSQLLAFTCQKYPDLEVQDNARIYLRMLLCIPGKKLKQILGLGKQLLGVSSSPHSSSFFQIPSPRAVKDIKQQSIFSYIHLDRVIPLLVKQTWSLALPSLGLGESSHAEAIKDISGSHPPVENEGESEVGVGRIHLYAEPLRVLDAKEAKIVGILRKYFANIPDYRHMPGIKINIPCLLRFEAQPFVYVLGHDLLPSSLEEEDELPALYATTLTFSSEANYGSIPACRVPFLLGEPLKVKSAIVPFGVQYEDNPCYRAPLTIELEPREPVPGRINVTIKASIEKGQSISGLLQSVEVGIEDMFLKPIVPSDVPDDGVAYYHLDLFHALWEACSNSASTGRETFPVAGGKGAAAISGTRSVKLLEVPSESLIDSIQRHMAPFVVSVAGGPLVDVVKNNGVITDVVWEDNSTDDDTSDSNALLLYSEGTRFHLEYSLDEAGDEEPLYSRKKYMGVFRLMMFLPPRFHILFQMEVADVSTLVRIRTDHWPCLAYVDEYLESLFST